jgi:MFS family permease
MDRDYRIILAASGLSATVTAMLYASLQFMAFEKGGSLVYVGLVGSLPYAGMMVMAYVWGLLSDWLGKRKGIVVASGVAGSLLFFIYPWLTSIEMLIAVRFVQVCLMGSVILLIAVVTERFPGEKGKVIGDLNVPLALGWVIGAGAAAYLYMSPQTQMWLFFLCGLVGLASALVLLPLKEVKKDNGIALGSLRQMLTFRRRRPIFTLCGATLVLLTGNYIVYSVFAQYLKTPAFGLDELRIGLIVAGSGLTGMLVFRAAGKLVDKAGRRKVLLPTIFTYMISWTAYALTQNIYVIVFIWITPYWSFFTTSSMAMVSDLTDDCERGRGIGILNAAINFGNFAGSLLGGVLAASLGFQPAFAAAAIIVSVAFVIALGTKESNTAPHPPTNTPLAPPDK